MNSPIPLTPPRSLALGDLVVPVGLPKTLQEESIPVFQRALGSVFPVTEIQLTPEGAIHSVGLDVERGGDGERWSQHTIYLEPGFVRAATLLEVNCHLPNGLHDFAFDSIEVSEHLLTIIGKAWVGNLDSADVTDREERRPARLDFLQPAFITFSGCTFEEVGRFSGDWGHIEGGDPARIFFTENNALVWVRSRDFLANLSVDV